MCVIEICCFKHTRSSLLSDTMSRVQAIYSIDIGVNDFLKIVEKDAPVDMDISYIREYYYKKVEKFRDKYKKVVNVV